MPHEFEGLASWDSFPTVNVERATLASATNDMTALIIFAVVRMVPLLSGFAVLLDMKK